MCGPRANGRDGSDKYDQFQSIHSRQMQERGLAHLPVADDFGANLSNGVVVSAGAISVY
jgi:hypothetical protein